MEIKEAIEVLKNEQLDIFDGRYGKAFKIVREALRNGYTLCKVDNAVEEMMAKYMLSGAGNVLDCIDIIKESCK